MGRFAEALQRKKVKGPLSYGFSIPQWRKAADKLCDDEVDRNLRLAGDWMSAQFEALRSAQVFVPRHDIALSRRLRAVVATANYAVVDMLDRFDGQVADRLGDRRTFMHEEFRMMDLDAAGDATLPLEAIVESVAAALLVAFRYLLRPVPADDASPAAFAGGEFEAASFDLYLAGVYYGLESTWERCLWEGYEFSPGLTPCFRPRHWEALDAFIVTRERQDKLMNAQYQEATDQLLRDRRLAASLTTRPVVALHKAGKHQRLEVGSPGQVTAAGVAAGAMRALVRRQYFQEIWSDESPAYAGLTLDRVLRGWEVISSAAAVLLARVRADAPSPQDIKGNAPTLSVQALVVAMGTAMRIEPGLARQLIGFFVFRGEKSDDVWAQPLIEVEAGRMLPVFATIHLPVVQRLLDLWSVRLGLDIEERGTGFESHVREVVASTLAASASLSSGRVLSHAIKFVRDGLAVGDADLLIVLGDLVIVGEIKCKVLPDEPRDWYKHREEIEKAAAQALKMARLLEEDLDLCRRQLARSGFNLPETFSVLPVVVLNAALHAGTRIGGVQVADLPMMETYLLGYLRNGSVDLPNGDIRVEPKLALWSDLDDAVRRLPAYLAAPPQLRRLRQNLRDHSVPLTSAADPREVVATVYSRHVELDFERMVRAVETA